MRTHLQSLGQSLAGNLVAAIVLTTMAVSPTVSAQPSTDVAKQLAALQSNDSATGQNWFDLAAVARADGNFSVAAQALAKADEMQFSPPRIGMERARLQLSQDDPEAAVAELQSLLDTGFSAVGFVTGDPVINSMAGRTDYDALIRRMSEVAFPCDHEESFRDFDFWVGEWDVHVAGGTYAGSNVIERAQRGCVLIENWTSATGGSGMSINYLDKATDEWVQIWNAEGGSQINIRGGMTDEGMRLAGQIHYVGNGTTAPFRALWTLLPDGRVRQFFEQSNDGGDTWVPWFEGFYSRVQ